MIAPYAAAAAAVVAPCAAAAAIDSHGIEYTGYDTYKLHIPPLTSAMGALGHLRGKSHNQLSGASRHC